MGLVIHLVNLGKQDLKIFTIRISPAFENDGNNGGDDDDDDVDDDDGDDDYVDDDDDDDDDVDVDVDDDMMMMLLMMAKSISRSRSANNTNCTTSLLGIKEVGKCFIGYETLWNDQENQKKKCLDFFDHLTLVHNGF